MTKYLCYQYGVTYCSRSIGSDVSRRNQNNVNNNKVVFPADVCVLIKLLKYEKEYGAKILSQNFLSSHGHCQD